MGPPPTMPVMTSSSSSSNLTQSTPSDDPLAALMAPPPRPGYGAMPSMAADPLAALMAPPSRPIGQPLGMPPPMSIGSGFAPPGGGAIVAPPSFQMWAPPASASVQQQSVSPTLGADISASMNPLVATASVDVGEDGILRNEGSPPSDVTHVPPFEFNGGEQQQNLMTCPHQMVFNEEAI